MTRPWKFGLVSLLAFASCDKAKTSTAPTPTTLAPPPPDSHLMPIDMSRTALLIPKTEGLSVLQPFALQGGTNYMAAATYCAPGDPNAARTLVGKALADAGWHTLLERAPNEPADLMKFELPPNVLIIKVLDMSSECAEGKGRKVQVTHLKRDY